MQLPLLLDLRHYETVVAIVEFGTMTEAAAHLSTTQSALSHRLAEAERRLGTRLFDRGRNRRLTPTRDGLAVHQSASRAIAELARTENLLRAGSEPARVMIRIGVGSYDCYHWFPEFLAEVQRVSDDVDLELVVVGDAPGSQLAANEVDIVLALGRPDGDMDLGPLFDDELVLIAAPDHPLAGRSVIDAEDLVDVTYFTYNAQPTPGFEYDRFIRPSGVYPRVVRVVRQTSAIAELVAAGAGVSIMSRWAVEPLIAAGRLVAIRCGTNGLAVPWHGATRRGDDDAAQIVALLSSYLADARALT